MSIMLLFKNIKGERVDTVKHTLEIMKSYPYAEIHIGTDSQNINKETWDLTVQNPNNFEEIDNRTPEEIIANIEKIDIQASQAIQKIKELL